MTKPLYATVDATDLGNYIGYQVDLHDPYGRATIAAVTPGIVVRDPVRVELVEYPGYHLEFDNRVTLWAPVRDVPKPTEAHPDLIDHSHDTWRWYEGYGLNDPGLWSRDRVEFQFGPARSAGA